MDILRILVRVHLRYLLTQWDGYLDLGYCISGKQTPLLCTSGCAKGLDFKAHREWELVWPSMRGRASDLWALKSEIKTRRDDIQFYKIFNI
jgi:hypothetical protein